MNTGESRVAASEEGARAAGVPAPAPAPRDGVERAVVYGCITGVLVLLLGPMIGTGFTCDDDMFTATARFRWDGVWNAAWAMATGHGRFYHLAVYPLAQLPYLPAGFAAADAARVLSTASVFAAFFVAARTLLGSVHLASLSTLLAAALLTTTHMFNPVHALPLWFNLGLTILLAAVVLFARGRRRAAAALFFASLLFYETFFFYVALFPTVALLLDRAPPAGLRERAARALRRSAPPLAAAALWLVCWGAFRAAFPPDYTGGELSWERPNVMLLTVAQFSRSGLNLDAPWRVEWGWRAASLVASLLAFCGSFLLLRRREAVVSWRLIAVLAAVGVMFALAPNLIFGLTPRYRGWVQRDIYYLGSFYAAFSLVLVVGAALLALRRLASGRAAALWTSAVLSLAVAVWTYANQLESARFFREYRATRTTWAAVDDALRRGLGERLGPKAVLVSPHLQHPANLSPGAYDYWSFYLTEALGRPIQVIERPGDASQLLPARRALLPALDGERELWGLAVVRAGNRAAGVALGPIDEGRWREEPGKLVASRAQVWLVGAPAARARRITVAREGHPGLLSVSIGDYAEVEGADGLDLATVSLE